MSPFVLLLYVYGVLLLVGGIMGYAKAKSVPSLVAGGVCGIIALLLGYYYPWPFAPWAALVLALLLIFVMGRQPESHAGAAYRGAERDCGAGAALRHFF